MTWSLRLRNGDLDLSGAGYRTVTGSRKLKQDLAAFVLERMGTDDLHPEYGSLINGGRTADGKEVSGAIGEPDGPLLRMALENEIRRIVSTYQRAQLARAKDDRTSYSKVTLDKGEVLLSLTDISMRRLEDTLEVTLHIRTARNQEEVVQFALGVPSTLQI